MYNTNPLKLTNMDVIKSISLRLDGKGKYEENLSMPRWAVSKVFYFFLLLSSRLPPARLARLAQLGLPEKIISFFMCKFNTATA